MKITERQLRHIIRESLESAVNEVTSTGTFNMGDYFFDYESEDTIPDFAYMAAERFENHLNRTAGIKDAFNVDVTMFKRPERGDADINFQVSFGSAVKKGADSKTLCRTVYNVAKHMFKNLEDISITPKHNIADIYIRYDLNDPILKKNPRTMSTDDIDADEWAERGKRIKKHPIEMDESIGREEGYTAVLTVLGEGAKKYLKSRSLDTLLKKIPKFYTKQCFPDETLITQIYDNISNALVKTLVTDRRGTNEVEQDEED